jgi:diguanylate cyclase (GGDEF)-like protein
VQVEKNLSLNSGMKILLIGDADKAFYNSSFIDHLSSNNFELVTMPTLADAIGAAVLKNCAVIAIVISGNIVKLELGIRAIRNTCNSRIILLAQMYEEPIAIRLAGLVYNGRSLVDDYMICPVQSDSFYEFAINRHERGPNELSAVVVDPSMEMRVKYLERLATEDDLTGLKNRRYIWEFSRQIIEHARVENKRVTLLVFDIDDFKHYNDLYGHGAGDEILKQAGALMRRCCRSHDVIGRIGGDEFAVIFWDDPSLRAGHRPDSGIEQAAKSERRSTTADHPNEVVSIAKRFVRELENAPAYLGDISGGGLGPEGKGVLTISGGLASFPRDGSTAQELFQQADRALLEAKRSGKNRIYLVGSPRTASGLIETSNMSDIDNDDVA